MFCFDFICSLQCRGNPMAWNILRNTTATWVQPKDVCKDVHIKSNHRFLETTSPWCQPEISLLPRNWWRRPWAQKLWRGMQRQKSWNAVAFRAATTKQEKLRHKDTGDGDAYIFLLYSFMTYWNYHHRMRSSFQGGDKGTGFYMLLSCFIRHFRLPAFPPGFSQCTWHCPFSVDACCGQLGGLDLSEKTQIFQRSSRQARKCAKSFHGILENQNKVSQMQTGSASNEPESNIFRSF